MAQAFKCPNCKAPLKVDVKLPTFSCDFCHHQGQNPLHRSPQQRAQAQQPQFHQPSARAYVLPLAMFGVATVLVGGMSVFMHLRATRKARRIASTAPVVAPKKKEIPEEPPEDAAMAAKLDAFSFCVGGHESRVRSGKLGYLAKFKDPHKPPRCGRWGPPTYIPTADPARCIKKLNKIKTAEPRLPELEATIKPYSTSLQELFSLTTKLYRYYSQKDYKDDKCARARAWHPKILATLKVYEPTNTRLQKLLIPARTALWKKRMKAAEERHGKGPRSHIFKLLLSTQAMIQVMRQQAPLEAPEVDKIKGALESFKADVETMEQMAVKYKDTVNGWHPILKGSWVYSAVQQLQQAAKEFLRKRATGKRRFSRRDRQYIRQGSTIEGSFNKVYYYWNSLLYQATDMRLGDKKR